MKSIARLLLVGAVAMAAMAVSVAPSEAAKKKAAPCGIGLLCSTACKDGTCKVNVCGTDGKWAPAVFTPVCVGPFCPKAC